MKSSATVVSQDKITPVIYDMWLQTDLAATARPGQFVGLYPRDGATLLPRPISICEVSDDRQSIRLVYRVVGGGTAEFASYRAGDAVSLIGILGNGFPVDKAADKHVFLVGGGIGIPPLLETAKALTRTGGSLSATTAALDIFLGYTSAPAFLADELAAHGRVHIATEDGSYGISGNVIDALTAFAEAESAARSDTIIMACGPLPMLRAVKAYAAGTGMAAYLSLEGRMACGIGACLSCVCPTTATDPHSNVPNARICCEGPVFDAEFVELG